MHTEREREGPNRTCCCISSYLRCANTSLLPANIITAFDLKYEAKIHNSTTTPTSS